MVILRQEKSFSTTTCIFNSAEHNSIQKFVISFFSLRHDSDANSIFVYGCGWERRVEPAGSYRCWLMLLISRTFRTFRSAAVPVTTQRLFRTSAISRMRVIPVPVLKDNYSYLIVDDIVNEAAAVDPYTPSKVKEAADQFGVKVVAGITTHHHNDHSGGNQVSPLLPCLSWL